MLTSRPNDDIWPIVAARLGPLEKRALVLIYIDGLTQAQVAHRLRKQRLEIAVAVARALHVVAHAVETQVDVEKRALQGGAGG